MTYLLPHPEVLGFPSDDLLPTDDLLDDTKLFGLVLFPNILLLINCYIKRINKNHLILKY